MATTPSQFRVRQYPGFGGNFVDSQYLANSYDAGKPHIFEGMMMQIFAARNRFRNMPLVGSFLGTENYHEIDNEVFRWYLQGSEEKPLTIVENLEASNTTAGIGNQTFRVKVDEDWCEAPDTVFFEDNEYPCRIVDGPVADGDGFIYTLILEDDNPSAFVPADLLTAGKEMNKVWTSVQQEYNDEFGTQQYASIFQLESQVGAFAQKLTITDKALREQGRLGIEFEYDGKKYNKFLPVAEEKMNDELYMSMEAQYVFGKRSTKMGNNNYWRKTGPGARQQLADGHREFYSGTLTETFLIEYLLDIFFSRVDEGNRAVTGITGTMGSVVFHELLAASASSFFTQDTHFVRKDKTKGSAPHHLSYGSQYTHYQGPEGIEMTVVKSAMNDSRKYAPKMASDYPGRPLDSWRFTILDFGAHEDKKSNVQMLRVKDTYRHGYKLGTVGPNGPVKGGPVSETVAGYTAFTEGTGGMVIWDVTRSGELIREEE